jgi:hypothetical protein
MATNTSTPAQRKIVSVEILHLDETGYGPQGKHTRREWRDECLEYLQGGKDHFEAWQSGWKNQIDKDLPEVSLAATLHYDDGTQKTVLGESYETTNPYTFDFVAHTFETDVDASDITFEQHANFISATFSVGTNFSRVTFSGDANFSRATFSGFVDFSSVTFSGSADFISATFTGYADFSSATFTGDADFISATFTGKADFSSATFTGDADFSSATFTGVADFISATFTGDADFSSTTFTGDADFISATFTGKADFSIATFTGYADFSSATFTGGSGFQSTCFEKKSNFENAVFNKVGHFEEAMFRSAPPGFRGCEIEKTRLEFSDDSFFPQTYDKDADLKAAHLDISFLKRLSDQHGQTDQALNFNAMELRVKKLLPDAGWGFKIMTGLYDASSDFGRSFVRPIAAYGVIIICSLLLTLPFTDYSQDKSPEALANQALCLPKSKDNTDKPLQLSHGRAAFEYAMFRAGGVMDFTDTGKQNNAVNCKLFGQPIEPDGMRAWGIFKGIASLALLFLVALGLRNKYRIK